MPRDSDPGKFRKTQKKTVWLVLLLVSLLATVFLTYSQVDNEITTEDIRYIQKILAAGGVQPINPIPNYEEELDFIAAVQKAVLDVAARSECLPKGRSREPKDVYLAGCGESYDRSRVIEKILRNAGFKTRHVMIYSCEHTGSKVEALLSPGVQSHSLTEVSTKRGWLVLDPDDTWLSLDDRREPVSMFEIQSDVGKSIVRWNPAYSATMNSIYKEPFVFLYGLYSRHGQFYPPHNFIPDINWREFSYNLVSDS